MQLIPLGFVLLVIAATIYLGLYATKKAQTASDFFVAGRQVGVFMNASAISGEYLSAASFMGVAGLVMKNGYDALWYPVGYAAGYLFLLLFIAGPLRRFGAYTIPDFAEGRFDSPTFRKIAVTFVLFIGFFYTMPQMKGAGVTMQTIMGWPYWVGIAAVGSVITFNVALGGMKGITFVQAFQYWAKLFAIALPVFVLLAVFGGYQSKLAQNAANLKDAPKVSQDVTLKYPGKDKAPANAATFSALGETRMRLAQDVTIYRVYTTRPQGPGEDPHPDNLAGLFYPEVKDLQDTQLRVYGRMPLYAYGRKTYDGVEGTNITENYRVGQTNPPLPPTAELQIIPYVVTKDGAAVLQNGKPIRASARVEFANPTEATLPAGSYVPNAPTNDKWLNPFGPLTSKHGFPLLYTYSLIIALVCGTAGLPHILVRFYTNPDGRSAKKTTFWVMVLLGAFYVFTPVWGTLGRAILPQLYANSKHDSVVIALPKALDNEILGQVLSGITAAGAFAAFMSTFSGLLVSMSGALAHDIYGRMIKPSASSTERLRAFQIASVVFGIVSMLLGYLVETFDIAMMVGWAFAIGAASYFPLLLLGAWWRGLTKQGAASGMLLGGLASLTAIVCSMLLDKKILTWDVSPIARSLMEQPAIWGVPLALGTMVVVSLLTARSVPPDINSKMLRLHAPEELGLSKNYIEH